MGIARQEAEQYGFRPDEKTHLLVPTEPKTTEVFRPSIFDRFPILKEIPKSGFPQHIFIIPDGNRRFAKGKEEEPVAGHRHGIEVILDLLTDLQELPVDTVGFWVFSSDNWKRPQEERDGLFALVNVAIQLNLPDLNDQNNRLIHLGRKDRIPSFLAATLTHAEKLTANNTGKKLVLAVDFSGVDQEKRQAQKIAQMVQQGIITPDDINEGLWVAERDGHGLVTPADLLIRTSEERTSGIGWINGPETELYFIPHKFFPEMTSEDIVNAILHFSHKQRRLGG